MEQLDNNAEYYARLHKKITKKSSKIIDRVIKIGIAKDAKSASILLSIVSIILIGASIYIFIFFNAPETPTYQEEIPVHIKKTLSKEFLNKFPSSAVNQQQ